MSLSLFCDKYSLPSEQEVTEALGVTAGFWMDLKQYIESHGVVKEEWKIYTQKAGWCKKLLLVSGKEERNLIFLYPNAKYFTGVLVFGDRAVEAARDSGLPFDIINNILQAKAYREGRSFQIEVRDKQDFINLIRLIDIKLQN